MPALGHVQVGKITPRMIDRAIDDWETRYSASILKNSIAPLVRVLDEAVREDVISANPAKNRARRSLNTNAPQTAGSPRAYAIPDLETLDKLADACGLVHQSYHDHVMLAALLAARGSEVAGSESAMSTGPTGSSRSHNRPTQDKAASSPKRPRGVERGRSRSSRPSSRSSSA